MAEEVVKNDDVNIELESEFINLKSKLSAMILLFKGVTEISFNQQWVFNDEEFLGITLIMEEMLESVKAMFDCYTKEV
jgi:hypothetical protein